MYCTACGAKIEEGAVFCSKCGAKTDGTVHQTSPADTGRIRRLFQGRIGPLRYFLGIFFCLALSLIPLFILVTIWGIVNLISNATGATGGGNPIYEIFNLLIPILIALSLVVPIFVGHIALAIRRCHDFGYSGWLTLCSLIPYVGFIFVLIFLFKKGEGGSNQYGPAPRPDRKFLADVFNY